MKYLIYLSVFLFANISIASKAITVTSGKSFNKTVSSIQKTLTDKKLKIFSTIEHHKGADSVGLKLRPTTLIIFGNPKAGTPLMNENQTLGLDLPLKVLITEGADQKVQITYKDPSALKKEYGLKNTKIIGKMKGVYKAITKSVTN